MDELTIVSSWIKESSNVLDMGCGEGKLLNKLRKNKNIKGYGLEIDEKNIQLCLEKGVAVLQQDLNAGLNNFQNQAFDTVLLMRTLQAVKHPDLLVEEMLRIGKQGIVTFPNFSHWRNRVYLGLRGLMPISKTLPYQWYETPNIHLCTFKDFNRLCARKGWQILDMKVLNNSAEGGLLARIFPNLFAEVAIYRLTAQ